MRRIGRAARLLETGSFFALLLLLPFSKAAVELSFGGLLIGWLIERLDPATRADTIWLSRALRPLAGALLVFFAVCAASVLVSAFPVKSLHGLIGKWAEYLLLLVIAADVSRRPAAAKWGLPVLAWSSLGVAAYGVIQILFVLNTRVYDYHPLWYYRRMLGPYETPIDLATYLMVVIFVLLGYAITRRGLVRWGVGGLIALHAACLANTHAVGAWLGACAGLLVMSAVSPRLRRHGLVLLALAAVVATVGLSRQGRLGQLAALSDIGVQDRWAMWQAALGMIRDRPILGHGVNTFMANYLTYWVSGERQPRYAHNCYLQVAAETGLIGLAIFLILLGLLFARLVSGLAPPAAVRPRGQRAALPAREWSEAQFLVVGGLGGLVAFAIQAGLDTNFYSLRQAALFWMLAGLAIGWRHRRQPS